MIETYLNEYFNYIRTVYLREYSKYLSDEKISRIKNMNNVFKIDNDSKFKIFVSDKINICTNIEEFIDENNLNNDKDLRDISIEGRIYVKYLIDNKNNVQKIILETILESIIKYFIGNCNNVIKIGMVDLIVTDLQQKYNLRNVRPYHSKEVMIVLKLKDFFTEDILYKSILNNNEEILKCKYNEYIKNELYGIEYNILVKELNDEYFNYFKKIGKVYFSDTLYDYEKIDYSHIINEMNKIKKNHYNMINNRINRIETARDSILDLKKHLILFSQSEQNAIKNGLIAIETILEKINDFDSEVLYNKFLKIENELFSLTQKLWEHEISNPLFYDNEKYFKFLIGDISNDRFIETRLISNEQLDLISIKIKNYGFIFSPSNIEYVSTKNFLYTIDSNDCVEIDDLSDSKLLTPQIIIENNIKYKILSGKILLKEAKPCGIYVLSNVDKNTYEKALLLSEEYELPLIKIENKIIKNENYMNVDKKIKKVDATKQSKVSFSDKLKKISKKILYEEEIEDFKKVV